MSKFPIITRSVQNLRAQALGVGVATTEASLESALSKRGAGKIEEALAELRLVVKSGKMPEAQIALTQIGQIAVQYQKGPEQRGFVHEKLKISDPLYLTAKVRFLFIPLKVPIALNPTKKAFLLLTILLIS